MDLADCQFFSWPVTSAASFGVAGQLSAACAAVWISAGYYAVWLEPSFTTVSRLLLVEI